MAYGISLGIEGDASGQTILNLLYYICQFGGNTEGERNIGAFATAYTWFLTQGGNYVNGLHSTYTLRRIRVNTWDVNGIPDVNEGVLPVTPTPGQIGGDAGGPAPCVIMRFVVGPKSGTDLPEHALERTYLAIGPIADSFVLNDGFIDIGSPVVANAVNSWRTAFTTTLVSGNTVAVPNRIYFSPSGLAVGSAVVGGMNSRGLASFRRLRIRSH